MDNPNRAKKGNNATRLKPSERDKERYIAYEITSSQALTRDADRRLVEQLRMLFGIFMAPKANITSMKYNPEKQRGILRISRKFVDCLKISFSVISKVSNQEVVIKSLKTSGMIGKVKKYLE